MRMISPIVAAIALAGVSSMASAQSAPRMGGVINYHFAKGSVIVNGIPVYSFNTGKFGNSSRGTRLTEWLVNGTNTITITVDPLSKQAKATIELIDGSNKKIMALEQVGKGSQSGSFKVNGVPQWSWLSATPTDATAKGLKEALTNLHKAYGTADIATIIKVSTPTFEDSTKAGRRMSAANFKRRAGPMIKAGKVEPLGELTISRHADGKIFRIVAADGKPPITVTLERNGMKRRIRTGQWWSNFSGKWKVVR